MLHPFTFYTISHHITIDYQFVPPCDYDSQSPQPVSVSLQPCSRVLLSSMETLPSELGSPRLGSVQTRLEHMLPSLTRTDSRMPHQQLLQATHNQQHLKNAMTNLQLNKSNELK